MRRTMFVGNWKANKTIAETEEYFRDLAQYSSGWAHEVIIAPSFLSLELASRLMPTTAKLGAQDVSHFGTGAHCGEIPASLLKSIGVKYCLVGHVERRLMGEQNDRINLKVKNLLANGISPILCLGDTLEEYNNNKTREVIEKQVKECLDGVTDFEKIVIAYQPIWSIGTGYYASGEYAGIIADFIRKTVAKMTGNAMSANFPVLYGGTITAQNARQYLETPAIDGLTMGGTSLKPSSMSEIINTKFQIKKYSE